jgi:hypothetical protein
MKTSLPLRHSIERAPWLLGSLLVLLLLACFAVSPLAQAVTPAPDGSYTGFNTAEGTNALFSLTTGSWNTAIGANALYSNTTGSRNNALGVSALLNHKTNNYNNAVGALALEKDTSGNANNAFGDQALINNNIVSDNTGIGDDALLSNTSGSNNTAIGAQALYNNTTSSNNTAVGRAQESISLRAAVMFISALVHAVPPAKVIPLASEISALRRKTVAYLLL